ncbi:MAG: hypothetical protein WAR79_00590 [Melioribacteraceae bacterium]
MKALSKILFPHINWWLLLLLPLIFFGFYPSYFAKLFSSLPDIIHLHAFFMLLWITIAITQPFLIKKNKLKIHRIVGKISYIIMPVVFVTGYLVVRHAYYSNIVSETEKIAVVFSSPDIIAITDIAKENTAIGLLYLFWLVLFYILAVINRKKIINHATYMFAAILTLLGPTIDRILFQVYQYFGIDYNFFAENAVFLLIDLLLIALLLFQWMRGTSLKAVIISLLVYVTGQFVYHTLPKTEIWKGFVGLIIF